LAPAYEAEVLNPIYKRFHETSLPVRTLKVLDANGGIIGPHDCCGTNGPTGCDGPEFFE
jgi:hypothetical protein